MMPAPAYHSKTASETLAVLRASEGGLSSEEAAARLATYGPNELPREPEASRLFAFLKQFGGGLNLTLLAAAAVSAAVGHGFDAAAIMIELVINAIFGFVQERKAEHALARLGELAAPSALARRDGRVTRLPAPMLVPGDVVMVAEGDRLSADLRLLAAKDLRTDESALTGESVPNEKSVKAVPEAAPIGDRRSMLHMGTLVTAGEGTGVVVATGETTAFGAIAGSLAAIKREPTPLEARVSRLSRKLVIGALALCASLFVIGVLRGLGALDMFIFAVAAAVAAIPEGLPVVLAIVLAIGVTRMAKRNVITRHLSAVETLGSVDVICTDKTGTLTENKMTVRVIETLDDRVDVTGEGWAPEGSFFIDNHQVALSDHPIASRLVRAAAIASHASVEMRDGRWEAVGDPTEAALTVLGSKAGLTHAEPGGAERTLDEIPFNSERKFRAVLSAFKGADGKPRREIIVIGAFEALAKRSAISEAEHGRFKEINRGQGRQAMRVIAVAMKEAASDKDELTMDDVQGLTLLGLVGMIDPPRKGVKEALARCRTAGIRVLMMTGDHKETAVAIAREIGLIDGVPDGRVFTDAEVTAMDDAALRLALPKAAVFARVSPQTKLRVVTALRDMRHVVAMTGDGINDAPALKRADIGIAMGLTGTDVTREVAEMVLSDDNFISIVNAVEEGRIVFRNVKQTTTYLVMTNMGEIVTIAASMLMGLPLPLLPAQILWLNVVTDGFSDVTLATEPRHGDELLEPPRPRDARILSRNLAVLTAICATLMAAGTLAAFAWAQGHGSLAYARSVAFISISLFQLWNVFSMRSPTRSVFALGWTTNRWVFAGVVASLGLAALVMYAPFMRPIFRLEPVGLRTWLAIAAISSSIFWAVEGYKWLVRKGIVPKAWL